MPEVRGRRKNGPPLSKNKKASLAKIEVRSGRLEVGIEVGSQRLDVGKR